MRHECIKTTIIIRRGDIEKENVARVCDECRKSTSKNKGVRDRGEQRNEEREGQGGKVHA